MHFLWLPQRSDFRSSYKVILTALFAILMPCPTFGKNVDSFAYCQNHNGFQEFAGISDKSGRLKFGLQLWNPRGHFLGIYGVAIRTGSQWRYDSSTEKNEVGGHCRFTISRSPTNRLEVLVDPTASCQGRGGYGMELENMRFASSAFVGDENGVLDTRGKFFEKGDDRCYRYSRENE